MKSKLNSTLDRMSDRVTDWLGSTDSIILHTLFFAGIFLLRFLNVELEDILLLLTTAVSLEAIYLAVFIQRAVNKQSVKLEKAIYKIVTNVTENLEEPLDEVVGEIRKTVLETHSALIKKVEVETDDVVREIKETL